MVFYVVVVLFDVVINEIVSLISLSDLVLLAYRNAKKFCLLILCPAAILNVLMNSNHFLEISFRFPMYDSFTFFPVWIPSLSFF